MRFTIRYALPAEIEAIGDFCSEHRGEYLPVPDADDLHMAAENGYLFVVVDQNENVTKSSLHAVAGLFDLAKAETESKVAVQVYELACMAINKNTLTGLLPINLQALLISLRALALAYGASENVCLLTSVVTENARSLSNVKDVGLKKIKSPKWLRSCRGSWCSPKNEHMVVDLILKPRSLKKHAKRLAEFMANPVLRRENRDTGVFSQIAFDIDVPWLQGKGANLNWILKGKLPKWDPNS